MNNTRVKDGLRAGVAAVSVAAGLMALASTSQTPDGFIHASFGGPMDVFSTSASDVLNVGDNADASELAALLNSPAGPVVRAIPDSPYTAAFEAGAAPGPVVPPSLAPLAPPTAAPAFKDAAILPPKPVIDSKGRVDCSGALSCKTDPVTNVTTVTFPDGIVAIVQKINDLTVVAYKTLTDYMPVEIKQLLPAPPTSTLIAAPPAAPAPAPTSVTPSVAPSASATPSAPAVSLPTDDDAPGFDPGPIAPDAGSPGQSAARSGPRINVVRPPMDFSPDSGTGTGGTTGGQKPKLPVLGKVKDALDSAVGAVTDAVGKAINPGASGKAGGSTTVGPGTAGSGDSGTAGSGSGSGSARSGGSDGDSP